MEEQIITEQVPRTVMEPKMIQVPQQVMGYQTVTRDKVVEYERPQMIPGRYIGEQILPPQTVSVQMQQPMQQFSTIQQPMMGQPMMGQPMMGQPMMSAPQSAPVQPYQVADDAISA